MSGVGALFATIARGGDIGKFERCPICKEHDFMGAHRCKPSYEVRPDYDDGGDTSTIYADSPEEAAENFLEKHHSDYDYPSSMTVVVTRDDEEWVFEIEVETVPSFTASEKSHRKVEDAVEEKGDD